MKKKSCTKCKKQIIGIPHKLGGGLLCDECYPFERIDGQVQFKKGKEGSLTFGKYSYHTDTKELSKMIDRSELEV